jgi:5-formyltetrahydrofolate cyclo-ligase
MEESRKQLRTAGLKRRAVASPESCRDWALLIQRAVLDQPVYLAALTVAAYHPIGNEVDTSVIIDDALAQRKRVFAPESVTDQPGYFVQILEEDPEKSSASGRSVCASELADPGYAPLLMIVPGVLFDSEGHRLGRGGGWYDRVLQAVGERAVYMGLAYEFQVVPRIPTEAWDQRVDFVVTESRVIDFSRKSVRAMVR